MYTNAEIAGHFNALVDYYRKAKETQKLFAFLRAADIALNYQGNFSEDFDKVKFDRFGGSSINEVREFLATGSSARLNELKEKYGVADSEAPDFDDLKTIPELSMIEILRIWQTYQAKNVKEVIKLISTGILTDQGIIEKVSKLHKITYYRKRDKVIRAAELLQERLLEVCTKVEFAGSLRRGTPSVKDLDLVAVGDAYEIHKLLEEYSYVTGNGNIRIRAEVPTENGFTIGCDIAVTSNKEFASALCHWTGSMEFNIDLRRHAKSIGYSVNEHCITEVATDEKNYFEDEYELFRFLGVKYVEPKDRKLGAVKLI